MIYYPSMIYWLPRQKNKGKKSLLTKSKMRGRFLKTLSLISVNIR